MFQVAARITGEKPLFEVNVEKNVSEILDEGAVGVSSKDIDAVIFSHHHWVPTAPSPQPITSTNTPRRTISVT